MDLIELDQEESGRYSLWLEAGNTDVDDLIVALGHEPNGYFWDGIVQLLVDTEATGLKDRFEADPEAGAYCAYSDDRTVIEDLAARLQAVATSEARLRQLVDLAETTGFEFDD